MYEQANVAHGNTQKSKHTMKAFIIITNTILNLLGVVFLVGALTNMHDGDPLLSEKVMPLFIATAFCFCVANLIKLSNDSTKDQTL